MKKIISVLMAVLLAGCMSAAAFAEDTTVSEVKLQVVQRTADTEYTAYQVMSAKVQGTDANGNPVYLYEINPDFAEFFAAGSNGYTLGARNEILDGSSQVVVTDGTQNTNTTEASKLAAELAKYVRNKNLTGTKVNDGPNLSLGYYLVAETVSDTSDNKYVASKPILVDLRADTTIEPKDATIDLEKKIVEGNNAVDANDVSVGDTVHYQVTTSVPVYEAKVDAAKLSFVITDTLSAGLTYSKNLVITSGDVTLSSDDYTVSEAGQVITISLKQQAIIANQGKDLVLTYSAVLNPQAVVSSVAGNPNNIQLAYTNNPNITDSKNTITDETITYTYGFKIHKVDKNDNTAAMSGTTFTIKDSDGKIVGNFKEVDGVIKASDNVVIGADNYVTITGLDAGTYTVEETVAPTGYSKLGGTVQVTIKEEKVNSLVTGKSTLTVSGSGSAEVTTSAGNGTIDLVVKIENVKGISLPGTGGMGTDVFILAGAGLVLAAGGILGAIKFAKRRKHNKI